MPAVRRKGPPTQLLHQAGRLCLPFIHFVHIQAWPEVKACCEALCEHFPGFVWFRAFRRALETYSFPLFEKALQACPGPLPQTYSFEVTKIREKPVRDLFLRHLLRQLPTVLVQDLCNGFSRPLVTISGKKRDYGYMVVECMVFGAKVPSMVFDRWRKLPEILCKLLQRHLVPLPHLLPPLWPLVARLAVHRNDYCVTSSETESSDSYVLPTA